MAVGVSSSQSLRVQVGARYRDQDPDRASSRGRCLLAPGMSFLTHRAAPPINVGLRGQEARQLHARTSAAMPRALTCVPTSRTQQLPPDGQPPGPTYSAGLGPTGLGPAGPAPAATGAAEPWPPRAPSSPFAISSARFAIRLSFRPSFGSGFRPRRRTAPLPPARLRSSNISSAISSAAITSIRASPLGPGGQPHAVDAPADLGAHRLEMLLLAVLAAQRVSVAVDAKRHLRHRAFSL